MITITIMDMHTGITITVMTRVESFGCPEAAGSSLSPRSGEKVASAEGARRVRGDSSGNFCPSPGPRFARATLSPQERREGTTETAAGPILAIE